VATQITFKNAARFRQIFMFCCHGGGFYHISIQT
jgi:hypothetical protein